MLIVPVMLSESVAVPAHFTAVRTGMYLIYLDAGWSYREDDGKLCIFSGWAITGNGEVLSLSETAPDVLEKELKSADGYFCFIVIENDVIQVMKSLYRYCDVYYGKTAFGAIIGTGLKDVARISGTKTITRDFIRSFIRDSFQAAFLSPLHNTGKAYSGCLTRIDRENIHTEAFVNLTPLKKNTLDVIITIVKKLPADLPLALYLSGGLDSSIVFFVYWQQINLLLSFIAFHSALKPMLSVQMRTDFAENITLLSQSSSLVIQLTGRYRTG